MPFLIDRKTALVLEHNPPACVRMAAQSLATDILHLVGAQPRILTGPVARAPAGAILIQTEGREVPLAERRESFHRETVSLSGGKLLRIRGTDPLGTVFGIYDLSREALGVDPFSFWTGHAPQQQSRISVPDATRRPARPHVRYRGWFVNGEDCLIGWTKTYPPPKRIWRAVYETILRCGGNLVCPGTDLPRDGGHIPLAASMGLVLTHHHAEPLGAEFFARAFPRLAPHYDRHSRLFLKLYREAIERQRGFDVVWTLGFRGAGDRPFWLDDPRYRTARARGKLLSRVLRDQYELVSSLVRNPVFCTNLYGEMVELYQAGLLDIPEDVILVWGDNGYGAMVSRRMGGHDPRHSALPDPRDRHRRHGVYYHVNFHDLQASNQLAMLQVPDLIARELARAVSRGADDLLIVNSGNVRPHVLPLELVMELADRPPARGGEKGWADRVCRAFARRHFGGSARAAEDACRRYFRTLWRTSRYPDARAGDELYHHASRAIASACLARRTDEACPELLWARAGADFRAQLRWFRRRAAASRRAWDGLLRDVERVEAEL
ncbi:MAG: glycosyl hydrolase 115 family protein, partial [Planctomycetota bacterium]